MTTQPRTRTKTAPPESASCVAADLSISQGESESSCVNYRDCTKRRRHRIRMRVKWTRSLSRNRVKNWTSCASRLGIPGVPADSTLDVTFPLSRKRLTTAFAELLAPDLFAANRETGANEQHEKTIRLRTERRERLDLLKAEMMLLESEIESEPD